MVVTKLEGAAVVVDEAAADDVGAADEELDAASTPVFTSAAVEVLVLAGAELEA